jgi:hypothetical protein
MSMDSAIFDLMLKAARPRLESLGEKIRGRDRKGEVSSPDGRTCQLHLGPAPAEGPEWFIKAIFIPIGEDVAVACTVQRDDSPLFGTSARRFLPSDVDGVANWLDEALGQCEQEYQRHREPN